MRKQIHESLRHALRGLREVPTVMPYERGGNTARFKRLMLCTEGVAHGGKHRMTRLFLASAQTEINHGGGWNGCGDLLRIPEGIPQRG